MKQPGIKLPPFTLATLLTRIEVTDRGCWEWIAGRYKAGYGSWERHGYAHRMSFELFNGPIPAGLEVLHDCDNPPCCNPVHLKIGTHAENMAEAGARGRILSGESHPFCKLSDSDVRDIRRRYAEGELQRVLQAEYGVASGYVSQIVHFQKRRGA